ncbi:hypothetical protein GCM10010515_16170 [Streptomyces fructofermentans]|uniref:Uncharacterized protein n=1 Tax=Streptomyces fructofermentans TaxID=152141 RepID=A0A918K6M0_9ACTN|nr:hypothetical protein GCM10010515_16170 [Streptomyces fructofermentans]
MGKVSSARYRTVTPVTVLRAYTPSRAECSRSNSPSARVMSVPVAPVRGRTRAPVPSAAYAEGVPATARAAPAPRASAVRRPKGVAELFTIGLSCPWMINVHRQETPDGPARFRRRPDPGPDAPHGDRAGRPRSRAALDDQ